MKQQQSVATNGKSTFSPEAVHMLTLPVCCYALQHRLLHASDVCSQAVNHARKAIAARHHSAEKGLS